MQTYLQGLDILGAIPDLTIGAASGRAILIRVKDVPALVKSKGGATGALIQSLAPQTIEAKVYSDMRDQFASKLKEQGVDADVQVVEPVGFQSVGANPIWMPVALGVTGLSVLGMIWHFVGRRK